jgi:hypothetical protein|mmetsp:Transcript_17528/g.23674  ORF Transcript_17528/g.23674 Transcript_17528/m.23674 type:complete len:110 (+) Transcript_17528:55-384(+)
MDNYNWQLNKAVVDRLYYTERTCETTWGFCTLFTLTNLLYIKKGYFAPIMRQRLLMPWVYSTAFNATIAFILLKPLRPEEIQMQVRKRISMGKWLYSIYHLDPVEEAKQ